MARSSLISYAFVWDKCSEFQMTFPLEPLGQCCSNFLMSLLGAGERKIAKNGHGPLIRMVATHIYGKNLLKSSPEPNKPWALIFAKLVGDRRSTCTKIAKMMVLC